MQQRLTRCPLGQHCNPCSVSRCLFLWPSTGLALTRLLEGIGHNLFPSPVCFASSSLLRLHLVRQAQNPPAFQPRPPCLCVARASLFLFLFLFPFVCVRLAERFPGYEHVTEIVFSLSQRKVIDF